MPVDPELVETLTQQFKLEGKRLEALQQAAEERRKKEAEEKASSHTSLLERMLLMQANEAQEKAARRKFWTRFILGPSGVLTVVGGLVLGYFKLTGPPSVQPVDVQTKVEESQEAVKTKVDERVGEIETHLTNNDKKIDRTVEILLNQQVESSDGHDDIVKRIGKAHPSTKKIEEPDSVKAGRKKATAIKNKRGDRELGYDPADPLAEFKK